MKLSVQFALVSLPLLLVPWAGCAFLAENERALQRAQQQSAMALTRSLAAALVARPAMLYPHLDRLTAERTDQGLRVVPLTQLPLVDGWLEEWTDAPVYRLGDGRRALSLQLGEYNDWLFLALRVQEPTPSYHNPQQGGGWHSDRVLLRLGQQPVTEVLLVPEGPGQSRLTITGVETDVTLTGLADNSNTHAWWEETAEGYQIELAVPLTLTAGRLQVVYTGIDASGTESLSSPGSRWAPPPWLIRPDHELRQWLRGMREGTTLGLTVYDRWQWPLATVEQASPPDSASPPGIWLLRALYRAVLPTQVLEPSPTVAADGRVEAPLLIDDQLTVVTRQGAAGPELVASAPLLAAGEPIGVLSVSQPYEEFLALTDEAFVSLLLRGLLALGAAIGTLLAFAAVTSWRLRRIAQRLQPFSGTDEPPPALPVSLLGDEIDALAKRFNGQLASLSEYQRYLAALNQTLSHELRTPIAIVASSLENLRSTPADYAERGTLMQRASEGITRLQTVLAALQAARRLEQTIGAQPRQSMDIALLLDELCAAYRLTFSDHRFTLRGVPDVAPAEVAPDNLVQAMDKLVENAVAFAPTGSTIALCLEGRGLWWRLAVENEGSQLPPGDPSALFEPLRSHRRQEPGSQHMGLGLYIVRLVARQHGGEPFAANLADGRGVRVGFSVRR